MKKNMVLTALTLCLAASVGCAAEWTVKPAVTALQGTPKIVLLVGNSFMYYNCGVGDIMRGIARSKGLTLSAMMATIGGAGLDWHDVKSYLRPNGLRSYSTLNDGSNKLVFHEYPGGKIFDAVVLQDNSQGPIHPELKKFFEKYAAIHTKDIRATGAEPVFLATWAYKDRPEMTADLMDATTRVANANGALTIPAGLAFANALKARPDLVLTMPDNRHPTMLGTYLEGAVMFAALTRTSPEGSGYRGGCEKPLTDDEASFLQKIAWETVKEFYGWN